MMGSHFRRRELNMVDSSVELGSGTLHNTFSALCRHETE